MTGRNLLPIFLIAAIVAIVAIVVSAGILLDPNSSASSERFGLLVGIGGTTVTALISLLGVMLVGQRVENVGRIINGAPNDDTDTGLTGQVDRIEHKVDDAAAADRAVANTPERNTNSDNT
jgi:hypothetical protein